MLSNNSVKFSQVGLAILALFGLIFITGSAITALNPIVENGAANISSGNVAGLSTVNSEILPLNLTLPVTENNIFNVQVGEQAVNTLGTVIVSSDKLDKGTYRQEIVKLYNPNNVDGKTKVSFFMPQELKGKFKVYLEDSKDTLVMYTIEESYGPKTITIPNLSDRNFKIKVDSSETVTSPFQLVFVFTVGQ